jgi:hypothetical protein
MFSIENVTKTTLTISDLGPGIPETISQSLGKKVTHTFIRVSDTVSRFIINGDYQTNAQVCAEIQANIRLQIALPDKLRMQAAIRPICERYSAMIGFPTGSVKSFDHPYNLLDHLVRIYITMHWFIVGVGLAYQYNEMTWPLTAKERKQLPASLVINNETAETIYQLIVDFFKCAQIPKDLSPIDKDYTYAEDGCRDLDCEPHEAMLYNIWQRVVSFKGFGPDHQWKHTDVSAAAAEKLCRLFLESGSFNPAQVFYYEGDIKTYYDPCLNYAATPGIAKLLLDTGRSRPEVHGENYDFILHIIAKHADDDDWIALLAHPALAKMIKDSTHPSTHPLGYASIHNCSKVVEFLLKTYNYPVNIIESCLKSCLEDTWRQRPTPYSESEMLLIAAQKNNL